MPRKIEISHRTIVFIVLFLGSLWFLYFIRDVILQVFIALLIMTILNPTVTKLQKFRIPRAISVLIVYILVFSLLTLTVALMIPPLVSQTTSFALSLPKYLEGIRIPPFVAQQVSREIAGQLGSLSSQFIKIGVSVFSNVLSMVAIMVFALYFLLARNKIETHLSSIFKDEEIAKIVKFINRLEQKLGGWARGEIVLMTIVGLLTYAGLTIIGIPFALPLALLAGILEIVPNIGPTISAIPSIIIGFGISPFMGLAVIALGLLIQNIENYFFVPKIMQKSAGVSPIITLLSLIIGFKVAGIIGATLSVPVVITLQVLFEEFFYNKKI